jgi:hypothetical protein
LNILKKLAAVTLEKTGTSSCQEGQTGKYKSRINTYLCSGRCQKAKSMV